ncbi:ETX/MTX2 family pore-forming toxin [Bacillus thuringiensis]|uniref:ETX/MTX2 family pore-forming toxin n=1 Tax=Bacillus thuringiensis TaxID=1428 RepID=A0AAW9GKI1_BACTU|nr:ETX/MTX2 family pore-forming toxin [Bacillus thuringiensis]MDY0855438.1 ETX/MTX2 family pore-forming toxin [Bacillus thuringiensis]MDY4395348.1 ETX/MTX2 family pore-forming toxin [Bacillus thuringiensis]
MQSYKKMAVMIPFACMLSIGVVSMPTTSFADATKSTILNVNTKSDNVYNENKFIQDIKDRMTPEGTAANPNTATKYVSKPEYHTDVNNLDITANFDSWGPTQQIELLSYKNDGLVDQTWYSPEKSIKTTESFTYSNQEGVKLGVSSKSTLSVKIPFVAEGGQEITLSSEFNYTHTSSNTSTHEEQIIFKSQPVICKAGYTTTYFGIVKTANFSGTFKTKSKVNVPKLSYTDQNGYGWTSQETRPDFYNLKVYSLLTNGSKPTPSYLNFESYVQPDNQNVQIPIVDIQSEFSGEGGHYSEIYVKATPIDAPNKSITLPLKEYQNRVAKGLPL